LKPATHVKAADAVPAGTDERLQRLDQRITDLADRQDQMMRRIEAALEARDQTPRQPGAASGLQAVAPVPVTDVARPALQRLAAVHPVAARILEKIKGLMGLMFLICIICNLLLAIWIYLDIRKRGEGSGIFVVLALVAGIPAAIIYSLVRIGDKFPPPAR
jgi:hypothetical protein